MTIPTGVSIIAKESKCFNLKFVGCDRNSDLNTTQSLCLDEEASPSPSNLWLIQFMCPGVIADTIYEHAKTRFADFSLHQRLERLTECYEDVKMKLRG